MRHKRFRMDRIGGLSDGVFAIAMTLLVLELKIPEMEGPVSREAFAGALGSQWHGFVAWIISFAILCRLWITQHALLQTREDAPRRALIWNFVFLGAVSLIPLPTSLLSGHPEQPLSVIIFSAIYAIAGIALVAMWSALSKDVEGKERHAELGRSARRLVFLILLVACIASILVLSGVRMGFLVWSVVPLSGLYRSLRDLVRPREQSA